MELELFLLLLAVVPEVWGYPSGLVTESCSDLRPSHSRLNAQTGSAPFTVTMDQNSYALGVEVKGTSLSNVGMFDRSCI